MVKGFVSLPVVVSADDSADPLLAPLYRSMKCRKGPLKWQMMLRSSATPRRPGTRQWVSEELGVEPGGVLVTPRYGGGSEELTGVAFEPHNHSVVGSKPRCDPGGPAIG
jgi:hypothetical protein